MYNNLIDNGNKSYQVGPVVSDNKNDIKAELLKGIVSSVINSIQEGVTININNTIINPGRSDKDIREVLYTNICNGKVEECYNLLDNSVVLYSVCKSYIQNRNRELESGLQQDSRVQFLSQDIDNYNSNLKQNNIGQMSF